MKVSKKQNIWKIVNRYAFKKIHAQFCHIFTKLKIEAVGYMLVFELYKKQSEFGKLRRTKHVLKGYKTCEHIFVELLPINEGCFEYRLK